MRQSRHHTLNIPAFPRWLLLTCALLGSGIAQAAPEDQYSEDQIEIVEGEDRTVFEYRQNGVITMIKIVPKEGEAGRPYYMVPADGAPHFESLDHKRKLYPQWIILEW